VLVAFINADGANKVVKWQAGSVVLPVPDGDQQITWNANSQQVGQGANKIQLDGGTGNVSIPGSLSVTGAATVGGLTTTNDVMITTGANAYGRVMSTDQYHAMILRGDIIYNPPNYTVNGAQAVTTFVQFGGTYRFRHVTTSANNLVFEITPTSVNVPSPLTVTCASNFGNVRVAPATAGGESAIAFSRNPNHTWTNRGDTWIVGRNVFGVGDRNFAIARFGANAGNVLTMTEDGITATTGPLHVAGYTAGIRPFVSCAVPGGTGGVYWSRGQNAANCERRSTGEYTVTWGSVEHPDGAQYVPQYCLLNAFGQICGGVRTSTSMQIRTASDSFGTPADRDFWFTLH
jgi:hypothetical protein